MKTDKTKKAAASVAMAVLTLIAILLPLAASAEVERVEEPPKTWEYGIGAGYVDYNADQAKSTAYIDIRAMKRLAFPWLVGPGFTFSASGDILYFEANIPLALRVNVSSLKVDFIARPGIAYAMNDKLDTNKTMGVITGGVELKKFITKGTSVGLGVYYSATTFSQLNSFKVGIQLGF